jgi:hypothetical protein
VAHAPVLVGSMRVRRSKLGPGFFLLSFPSPLRHQARPRVTCSFVARSAMPPQTGLSSAGSRFQPSLPDQAEGPDLGGPALLSLFSSVFSLLAAHRPTGYAVIVM